MEEEVIAFGASPRGREAATSCETDDFFRRKTFLPVGRLRSYDLLEVEEPEPLWLGGFERVDSNVFVDPQEVD